MTFVSRFSGRRRLGVSLAVLFVASGLTAGVANASERPHFGGGHLMTGIKPVK